MLPWFFFIAPLRISFIFLVVCKLPDLLPVDINSLILLNLVKIKEGEKNLCEDLATFVFTFVNSSPSVT
jgi:hypothetical protein